MSDFIGKEQVLRDVDIQSDGTYVFYEELVLMPKRYDAVFGIYTCEMLTDDKRNGSMVRVHEREFRSNDDE